MTDTLRWISEGHPPRTDYKIFSVSRQPARHTSSGRTGTFTRIHSPNWVNVIALTPQHEVVLVKQYRHGLESVTLEIPGGMMDDGEDELSAGLRELHEETGYRTGHAYSMASVHPNPAFMTNHCGLVLALNVIVSGSRSLDPNEVIDVLTVPLADIPNLILSGEITHTLVISAFFFYQNLFGGWAPPSADDLEKLRV